MLGLIGRRLLAAAPGLAGVVVVTFLLTRALPGDSAAFFAGPAATTQAIDEIRKSLGLDRSLPVQFGLYIHDLGRGDLGKSLTTGQPVRSDLIGRLPASLELTVCGLLLALTVALPLGVLAATRPGSWVDHLCRMLTTAGVSLPIFFTGLLLVYVFYFLLGWAPAPLGRLDAFASAPPTITGFFLIDPALARDPGLLLSVVRQLALPAVTLGLFAMAPIARMTRAAMLGVLSSDFIRTARASGLDRRTILITYAFRNAMLLVTTLGMVFSFLLGANVLVEKVFAWPGIGSYALEALIVSDYAPVQGFILTMASLYVVLNLLIDVLYGVIDPRARKRRRRVGRLLRRLDRPARRAGHRHHHGLPALRARHGHQALGGRRVEIDLAPFRAAAELLYAGPWVAERLHALGPFLERHPEEVHPVVRGIVEKARALSAVDVFAGMYRLEALRRAAAAQWAGMDVLALPTTGTMYRHAAVEGDPIRLNSNLGYYTNFVNLLDCCALAVPAGVRPSGLPFGISLIAPAFHDELICALGVAWERRLEERAGERRGGPPGLSPDRLVRLAVVGAHLSGQPLNRELGERGARLVRACRTTRAYRLYALPGTVPPKPGLVRVAGDEGAAIEVEVWEVGETAFGGLVAAIPPPLAIGTVTLEDGGAVKGFLCEAHAVAGAEDISGYGGWRAYLAGRGGR